MDIYLAHMNRRVALYIGKQSIKTGISSELAATLQAEVEANGGTVAAILVEAGTRRGRGPQTGWGRLMTDLANVDQIIIPTVADLPGLTVGDLLKLLATLRQAEVSLYCHAEQIDTDDGSSAILDLIAVFRHAKFGQAVRRGQERARATGTHIGRPAIPEGIRRRIQIALADGGGIRSTARMYNVSPATVINVRRSAATDLPPAPPCDPA